MDLSWDSQEWIAQVISPPSDLEVVSGDGSVGKRLKEAVEEVEGGRVAPRKLQLVITAHVRSGRTATALAWRLSLAQAALRVEEAATVAPRAALSMEVPR